MTPQNSIDNENAHGKSTMANETQGTPVMGRGFHTGTGPEIQH